MSTEEKVKGNKFHMGNSEDGKHYWLTPPKLMKELMDEFNFNFDPCPFPKPADFDGLIADWRESNYVNPPFGSIISEGKKKGPTAWARKCIEEKKKGNKSVMVFPLDKWVLMMIEHCSEIRNLGDVKWVATEDGKSGKGLGRHIACFVLDPSEKTKPELIADNKLLRADREKLVEALRLYADPESYIETHNDCYSKRTPPEDTEMIRHYQHKKKPGWIGTVTVGGKLARTTLKELGEME